MLKFLKNTWMFAGIEAPQFIWVAAGALILGTFAVLIRFNWKVWRLTKLHRATAARMRALRKDHPVALAGGMSLAAFDKACRVFEATPSLQSAWEYFVAQRVLRRSLEGEDQVWVAQGAEVAFTDTVIIDSRINRGFFSAVPGIVTGTGLLFTFIAILVALLDVRLTGEKQVEGLDLLIKGLSGKFISSISALFAATAYLLCEKPLLHRLSRSRSELVSSINAVFPVLSQSQVLADLARDIAEQSTAFRSFNSDLSLKLKQSFSESMGPTLARMVGAVEELNVLLRAVEAQKQESITGSLEGLLQKLEASITSSLHEITNRLTESISTGARTEFTGVIDSLRGAAGLLEGMNSQFVATQHALGELTELSKRATTEQIQLGRTQIEELTEVLRGLMTQLNETAGTSVSRMASTLTAVVHDLSTRVAELGDKMTNSIIDSAGVATGAANEVIEKANNWSSKSAEQLATLLESYHEQIGTVRGLRSDLEESLSGFRVTLQEYGALNMNLKDMVVNASSAATSIGGVAKTMRDTHVSVERVAGLAAVQVEHLAQANRGHQETWLQIQITMEQYQKLFARVEAEASSLLSEIGEHLENYVATSRRGFEDLVRTSDEHFANATKKLGTSVNDLDEVLQVLIDGLEKRREAQAGGSR